MPSKGSVEVHCTSARFIFHSSRLSQVSAFCVLKPNPKRDIPKHSLEGDKVSCGVLRN